MAGNNKRIAINMIAQVVSFVVNVLINFFLTPYVTAKVGKSVYGFVNLAFQTTGYVTVVTSALNAMVGRYITINLSKKDYKSANTYFSSVVAANGIVSLILVIPSVFAILYLDKILNIPAEYVGDVKLLWAFIFAAFLVSLVTQFYSVATYAGNRLDLDARRNMETVVMKAILLAGCFFFFVPKLWYVGLANFVTGFYVIIMNMHYTKVLTPQLKFEKALVKIEAIKELVKVGMWNSVQQLSAILINGCDMLISNLYIDAAAMTLMGYAKTIPNYILSFIGMISGAFGPQMTILYGQGDMEAFVKQTKSAIKVCGFLCSVPILGFIAFGTDFFSLWLYVLNDKEITTIQILSVLILLQTVFDVYIYPLYSVNTITARLKTPVLVSLGIGVANIIGSILLCKYTSLGIYAIQIVSSVLLTARVFFFAPIYAAHVLEIKWYTFYGPLLRGLTASAVVLAAFYGYRCFVAADSWISLIGSALICGVIGYVINYIIVLDKQERVMVKEMITRKLKKS